jgi:hypothetical protein
VGTPEPDNAFVFETSPTPEAISWARAFVAAVATASGADPEAAADVRLAVSEIVSTIVRQSPSDRLAIRGRLVGHRLRLEIAPWDGTIAPDDEVDPWEVVQALVGDAIVRDGAAVITIPLFRSP